MSRWHIRYRDEDGYPDETVAAGRMWVAEGFVLFSEGILPSASPTLIINKDVIFSVTEVF